jgi:NADP-dependent aldehyde dehydrogenase
MIAGTSPYTGRALPPVAEESTAADVNVTAESAEMARAYLDRLGRAGRAGLLRAIALTLEAHAPELVRVADEETGIGPIRLTGELARAVFQLRFFAEVLAEGSYLEATIDTKSETPMGPRPDLRRMLTPIGPVAVFGASNFPFAFSVAGGDTASALAAGCPVIVKAHSSHPETAHLSYVAMSEGAKTFGAPASVLGIVYGREAGTNLVKHPHVQAVGFTGSIAGGTRLLEAISGRAQPIPFYGELSSLNPLIISHAAAAERAETIGSGLAASITTSSGQLCTKPGIIFVPEGEDGERLIAALATHLTEAAISPLLNRRIYESYGDITDALDARAEVTKIASGRAPCDDGFRVAPKLYSVDASQLRAEAAQECFGPSALVVRYRTAAEVEAALAQIEGALTITLHVGRDEPETTQNLTRLSLQKAGRIIYNGYPTGVSVSWGQTHGGPWPATNSLHTSVGAAAIRRFLRPITFQDAPKSVLPPELRDGPLAVPTRINGKLVLPPHVEEQA